MTQVGYRTLIDHYERCLAEHGDTHRGVDWPNATDADTRYRVMLDVIDALPSEPVRLLDFGCGAAHLYEYIVRERHSNIEYVGLDGSEKFIALSRQKFPHLEFHALDVLADDRPLPEVDYIVMNGVLTEKREMLFDEMWAHMERLLARVFECARVGMAFNVMSKHVDWERDDLFHVPFDPLFAFLKRSVSRHVRFRADYGLYEYTTYVYREPR
jgi:SAM-dependent methyltransferase